MQIQRLTDFSQVEMLYRTRLKKDFPRSELKPLSGMRHSWEKEAYDCYTLVDGDNTLGYAFFVRLGDNYLFDYLAIVREHRDEGLGSLFLKLLADRLQGAECVVGEVEDPDKATNEEMRILRERRMQFYLRAGYRRTELTSIVFGVAYRILEVPTGKEHTSEELREIYSELYRSILPRTFFQSQFQVE